MPFAGRTAAVLIAACSVAFSGLFLLRTIQFVRWTPVDAVTYQIERFSGLVAAAPQGQVLGYIADPNVPAESDPANFRYFSTGYCFTPVFVDRSINHRFIVGNFDSPPPKDFLEKLGLHVIRDFGRGVLLLENPKFP